MKNDVHETVCDEVREDEFDEVFDVLSDNALLEKVEELIRRERRITFNVVIHLGEVERRRIYVHEGYASMFDYCTRGLGYSESAAYRRIKTYRCIRDYPDVADLMRSGKLTITTAAMIAGVMNRENYADLLRTASGKSQRDVQKIVAGLKTGKPFRDRIRSVVIERPAVPLMAATPELPAVQSSTDDKKLGQINLRHEGKNNPTSPRARLSDGRPTIADTDAAQGEAPQGDAPRGGTPPKPERTTCYKVTIAADEEFMQMYRRVRSIQSIKANPGKDIAATFKALMSEFITRHAPEEKQARRAKRTQAKARRASTRKLPDRSVAQATHENPKPRSRTIPARVKDKVLMRDKYQCTYVGSGGARCNATQHLQFDHVVPFARGGGHIPDNLRLLCSAHNRREAKGAFGKSVPDR